MTSATTVGTVLVVEDLAPTRDWLGRAVHHAYPHAHCQFADCLQSARVHLLEQLPDLALIDLRLPDGDGAHLIQTLRAAKPTATLIVPTVFDDDVQLLAALKAGASGYVFKDHTVTSIADELQRIRAGKPPLSVPLARRLQRLHAAGSLALTPAEASLLRARARGTPVHELQAPDSTQAPEHLIAAVYARLCNQTLPVSNAV